jgi:hypothetical protein
MRRTLLELPEDQLAALQVDQRGNTCSFHAISTAIKLLFYRYIDPETLSTEANRLWWRARFMRIAPDWAVTPQMQTRIVQYITETQGLPLAANFLKSSPQELQNLLIDPSEDVIPIITILWLWGKAPPIYYGNSTHNFNKTRAAGAHSMIFAAYDPDHQAGGQFLTPWGFINTWRNNASHLFWMTDVDFRKAWHFWLPGIGPNPLVLIKRTI